MNLHDMKTLNQMQDASEVCHRSGWYLLAEDGMTWRTVGGPYHTRAEARYAKRVAADRWYALPWDVRSEYYQSPRDTPR